MSKLPIQRIFFLILLPLLFCTIESAHPKKKDDKYSILLAEKLRDIPNDIRDNFHIKKYHIDSYYQVAKTYTDVLLSKPTNELLFFPQGKNGEDITRSLNNIVDKLIGIRDKEEHTDRGKTILKPLVDSKRIFIILNDEIKFDDLKKTLLNLNNYLFEAVFLHEKAGLLNSKKNIHQLQADVFLYKKDLNEKFSELIQEEDRINDSENEELNNKTDAIDDDIAPTISKTGPLAKSELNKGIHDSRIMYESMIVVIVMLCAWVMIKSKLSYQQLGKILFL